MASKALNKPRLSKGILEMKFMQRTKAKVDKEIEDAEGRAMYSNEITERMLQSNSNFIIEPSFVHCENLIEGRLSFRGMNPEIERLLEIEREEKEASKEQKQTTEVSNDEMRKFYNKNNAGAAHTIEKKFSKSKNNNKRPIGDSSTAAKKKKYKFMKPEYNDDTTH